MASATNQKALSVAKQAALAAGDLLRRKRLGKKKIHSESQHDLKLELDLQCQKLIEGTLRKAFPSFAILGEENSSGATDADFRWVIDPIDGTVNFGYGIPHSCISIALQRRLNGSQYQTMVGVVYDPMRAEMWTAIRGQSARLNGSLIRTSSRARLGESVISIGDSNTPQTVATAARQMAQLVPHARKMRIMGSAALGLTYVACGRFDAYIESEINLWDIAAGGLVIECAGGEFWCKSVPGQDRYQVVASNGLLRPAIQTLLK